MNWCEVPLFSKSTIFEQYNKRSGKCFFEVKRKLLKYSICFYDKNNLKSQTDAINSRPLKIGNLGEIHSSGIENIPILMAEAQLRK